MVKLTCTRCGRSYVTKPFRASTSKYCSLPCRNKPDLEAARSRITDRGTHFEVKLTSAVVALLDREDIDLAVPMWCSNGKGYAVRERRRRKERLHRLVLERKLGRKLSRSELVDHKNHNPSDDRRTNLRLATPANNSHNQQARAGRPFKGVRRHYNYWRAYLRFEGKRIDLGGYSSAEEAAYIYDQAALQLFGEFAAFNILDK